MKKNGRVQEKIFFKNGDLNFRLLQQKVYQTLSYDISDLFSIWSRREPTKVDPAVPILNPNYKSHMCLFFDISDINRILTNRIVLIDN
jgi:hypothetical protein